MKVVFKELWTAFLEQKEFRLVVFSMTLFFITLSLFVWAILTV